MDIHTNILHTADISGREHPNEPRIVGSALGGAFIALAIIVLSGVLLAWFIWSAKHKKKYFEASRTQNMYHMDGSEYCKTFKTWDTFT